MIRYQNTEDFNGIVITDGLLKQLHEMFPDRLPSVLVSEPELCKLIGQQQVVRWLQDKQDLPPLHRHSILGILLPR